METWEWVALAGAVGVGFYLYETKKKAPATPPKQTTPGPSPAPAPGTPPPTFLGIPIPPLVVPPGSGNAGTAGTVKASTLSGIASWKVYNPDEVTRGGLYVPLPLKDLPPGYFYALSPEASAATLNPNDVGVVGNVADWAIEQKLMGHRLFISPGINVVDPNPSGVDCYACYIDSNAPKGYREVVNDL